MKKIELKGRNLNINKINKINLKTKIVLNTNSLKKIKENNIVLKKLANEKLPIYGLNRGVGCDINNIVFNQKKFNIDQAFATASGFDYSLSPLDSKKVTIIRLNEMLSKGSTIRPILIRKIAYLINKNIIPCYPKKGSVSAGDICILSHLTLVLMGDGYCWFDKKRIKTSKLFRSKDIKPIEIKDNESLVIMSSNAYSKYNIIKNYISLEKSFKKSRDNFYKSFSLIKGNSIVHSISATKNINMKIPYKKIDGGSKIQDPLSFRTFPIKLKLLKDNLESIKKYINKSINTCDTNPSIFTIKEDLNIKMYKNKSILPTLGFDLLEISLKLEQTQSLVNHLIKSQYYIIEKLLDAKYNGNNKYISNKSNDFGIGYITRIISQNVSEALQDNIHSFNYIPTEEMVEDFATNTLSMSNCLYRKNKLWSEINKVQRLVNYLLDPVDNSLSTLFDKNSYFDISYVLENIS